MFFLSVVLGTGSCFSVFELANYCLVVLLLCLRSLVFIVFVPLSMSWSCLCYFDGVVLFLLFDFLFDLVILVVVFRIFLYVCVHVICSILLLTF